MAGDPRWTAAWKRVRAQVLREETHCWRCGLALVPDAPPRTRWSSSVDHVDPLASGGDPYDRTRLRAAHYGCNARRGARVDPQRATVEESRWING